MKKTITPITIILNNAHFAFFKMDPENYKWALFKQHGESWNKFKSECDLAAILDHLNKDLNKSTNFAEFEIIVLYSADQISYLKDLSPKLNELNCPKWQVLSLESLIQQSSSRDTAPKDLQGEIGETLINERLLPLLSHKETYIEKNLLKDQERTQSSHEETLESLRKERQNLENQVEALQIQIRTIALPDMEVLLTFLPIIYRNFWLYVKPEDLALLAGTYQIPEVKIPFPEPSIDTIAIMKKRLQNLPEDEKNKLINFCEEMTYRNLKVRPEMQFLIGQ